MIFLLNILIILSLFYILFLNFKIFILTCYKIVLNNLYTNVRVGLKLTIL